MILGTGVDIVQIARIEASLKRFGDSFLERIFTPEEVAYCKKRKNPAPSIAARFAAKEALVKSLPEGESIALREIEVATSGSGKPSIMPGKALETIMENVGARAIHLSLSHERDYAIALVILEG